MKGLHEPARLKYSLDFGARSLNPEPSKFAGKEKSLLNDADGQDVQVMLRSLVEINIERSRKLQGRIREAVVTGTD
ncbi:hypothetical protein PoB_002518500 [Plakobranchus ocellatus]|uniref:Uncharacterized protein n=1 Tax=Plakobranchus ocellatus TaxID=259542 RepID=A0AAV3ZVM2_9GAST|nr:hypothetical protein PoB_002518500 [Plakobranchus ocellatus]